MASDYNDNFIKLLEYIERIKLEYPEEYLMFNLGLSCLYMPGQLEVMLTQAERVLGIEDKE